MHILIAPNTFKHSLDTFQVAEAIRQGLENSLLAATFTLFPIADGGEGLLDILVRFYQGEKVAVAVQDPLGRDISACYGLIGEGRTAVIELAAASGLKWLKPEELNPLAASTYGTGQLIWAALEAGVRDFIIGLGNSATVDGGTGLLQALGLRLLDAQGLPVGYGAASLARLHAIDSSSLDPRLADCRIRVACDVENPLLGDLGAARVFGPQKGADAAAVEVLEGYLGHLRQVSLQHLGQDMALYRHGGAAGGTAAALKAFLSAELLPGVDFLLDLTGFDQALNLADLLITAEGEINTQTLAGKGPYGAARLAKARQLPVIALTGQLPEDLNLADFVYFDAVFPISRGPVTLQQALETTAKDLERTARQVGRLLQLQIQAKAAE
ncbi:MAG: glycerate kinase [Adhaeribacter sp.]